MIEGEGTPLDFVYEESKENHYFPEGRVNLAKSHIVPLAEGNDDRV